MKFRIVSLSVVLLSGCAMYTQTSFSEYRGPSEFTGRGGTVKSIDGIDVWTSGEPNRKFRVLGMIDQSHYDNRSVMSFIAGANKDSAIIAEAKKRGGDAIVFVAADSVITGYTTTGWATGQTHGTYTPTYGGVNYSGSSFATGMAQTDANTRSSSRVAVIKYLN